MNDDTISKEYVEKRVEDWVVRLSSLYATIKEWLTEASSYEVKERSDITMYEELMQKSGISKKTLNSLDVYHGGRIVATIKPIGLWIIGANGRVDILFEGGAVILVDEAERFQKPRWVAHKRPRKDKCVKFDKHYMFDLLGVH